MDAVSEASQVAYVAALKMQMREAWVAFRPANDKLTPVRRPIALRDRIKRTNIGKLAQDKTPDVFELFAYAFVDETEAAVARVCSEILSLNAREQSRTRAGSIAKEALRIPWNTATAATMGTKWQYQSTAHHGLHELSKTSTTNNQHDRQQDDPSTPGWE